MLGWSTLADILTPRYWFPWLWTAADQAVIHQGDDSYLITQDNCAKCNRFLSWHSRNNAYCSYHNVTWATGKDTRKTSYELFKSSFEMWLRSRCGGDMDEVLISTNLLTLSSYLDFALTHSKTNGNLYDFCDAVFCDYQMVYDFLMDMRLQAKERHTVHTELRICEALHRFIEFRKFQLPIKGIVENRYSATERLLENYRMMLLLDRDVNIDLMSTAITYTDIQSTITHFIPQYDVIISYFTQCHNVRSMENGCDIEFATSFLCAYLYSIMPDHVAYFHMVRVRDLCLDTDIDIEFSSEKRLNTKLSQYVSSSSYNLPSPVIASACINKLQKCLTLDEKTKAIVAAYITFIRPRITKSNDYLLLSSSALGLTAGDVEERIVTLVYRVTGKVTDLVDRFEHDVPSTPKTSLSRRYKIISQISTQRLKKVRFSRVVSRKQIKRFSGKKLKVRRNLILDLTNIPNDAL